jgi:hypothetical protein
LATKWGSTFTSLLLFLKGGLGSWEAFSFPKHNFQFNLENICSHKLLEEEKNDQPWLLGKGKRVEWKFYNSFEGMEVSSDSDGRLET